MVAVPNVYWIRVNVGPALIQDQVMIRLLSLLISLIVVRFKSRAQLEGENVVLRHQISVLRRHLPQRLVLSSVDRLVFVWLYRVWPGILNTVLLVRPESVIRWHRAGFRAYWRWRSRPKWGRPKVSGELRRLVRQMSLANRPWGAPRIHGELC